MKFRFHQNLENFWTAERLSGSHIGLWYNELIKYFIIKILRININVYIFMGTVIIWNVSCDVDEYAVILFCILSLNMCE
jgi:hypothetical protein